MADSEKTPLLGSGNSTSASYNNDDGTNKQQIIHDLGYQSQQTETHVNLRRASSVVDGVIPINLSWTNVNVSVIIPGKRARCCGGNSTPAMEKTILKGVTGHVKPGNLLAIIGASGAGKSTLLNILTQRNIRSYQVSGDIRVNGWQIGENIKKVSAYVQQDDLFMATLTVREQLQFRALLRMDNRLGKDARLARVEEVINEMGLSGIASSIIGAAGGNKKGLSGGERKRLSFASEALTNPPVFFCDEPTSGLDTFMAQNIVGTLKKMASRGRAILCTIHQPSSELFAMFNQLLVLAEGRTAFMGSPAETMEHFQKLNFPCPQNYNPADHYILTLAIIPGQEQECRQRTHAICDAFDGSSFAANIASQNDKLKAQTKFSQGDALLEEATAEESRYQATYMTQLRFLFWRAWISQFRDVMLFNVRIIQSIVSALVFSLVYLQLDVTQTGVIDINGAIFVVIINISFSNLFAVVNSFPIEMGIFLREYGSQLYRADVYYITKTLSELPVFLLIGTIFITMVYWMMGLYNSLDAYLIALGVLLLTANTALSLGYLISTLAGSVTAALAIAPPLLIPFMLFGGFFLSTDNIPVYFIWLEYVSWFKYATEIMMVNQWQHIDHIPCRNSSTPTNVTQTLLGDADPGCLFRSGADVLAYRGFEESRVPMDLLAIAVLMVGFKILAFIALLVRARRSKE